MILQWHLHLALPFLDHRLPACLCYDCASSAASESLPEELPESESVNKLKSRDGVLSSVNNQNLVHSHSKTQIQHPPPNPTAHDQIRQPKRFIKNQTPHSITNDPTLNAAIALLPSNYNFEIHKSVWRVRSTAAKRVALQFPEGLLMYSLVISDIITAFADVDRCFVLGDVTYGACCVDDLSAAALDADLLIHYGHSCLVPVDNTVIPCLYVFVDIKINVERLINTVKLNFNSSIQLVLAGTIQFATAIRAAKPELENAGFRVLIPQSKPLSAGEVLGWNHIMIMVTRAALHINMEIELSRPYQHFEIYISSLKLLADQINDQRFGDGESVDRSSSTVDGEGGCTAVTTGSQGRRRWF
ncbi:hypothetical protein SSX86_019679 [Deinandra increscens subsp. villosa]|uniref:2-(3-amino-3-carboxypropyl)histidine synthase subunit 1 n=1 Tax=Deinandra increscens subsp. villosa TaxID=3103831 RepID=A0AAP0CYE5_9ASTR